MKDWQQKISDIISSRCTHEAPEFIEFSTVKDEASLLEPTRIKTLQGCHWCHQTYLKVLAAVDEGLDDLIACIPSTTDSYIVELIGEFKRSISSG